MMENHTETTNPARTVGSNPSANLEHRIEVLERVIAEQRDYCAKSLLNVTRELDMKVRELHEIKLERNLIKVVVLLVLGRLKRSTFLHRVLPRRAKEFLLGKLGVYSL